MAWDGPSPQLDVDNTNDPNAVKAVGESPEYRRFLKTFIQSEAAPPSVPRMMVENIPLAGQAIADKKWGPRPNPARPEHYMEQVLGPEKTSKSNLGAVGKGLARVYHDPEGMAYNAAVNAVRGIGEIGGTLLNVPQNVNSLMNVYQGMNPFSDQSLVSALADTPYANIAGGIIKGTAAPFGLAGGEAFRESWQQAPLESIATVSAFGKPIKKGVAATPELAKSTVGTVKAIPGKLRQLELDVRSGTIGAKRLEPRVPVNKLTALENKYSKLPEAYNAKRAATLWEQMSRPGDERLLSPEGRGKIAAQGRQIPNILKTLAAENRIPKVKGDLIGQMESVDAALRAIGEGELGVLRTEVQRVAPQMPPEVQLQHRRFWESRSEAYRNQGDTALANSAADEAEFYRQPRTFDEFYQRSQRAGDAINWLKEEQTPLKADLRKDRAMLRNNMDAHAQQVLPENTSLHTISRDYAALAEYQERLSDIFMDEVLAKLDTNAQAGINRLAAAQAAAGVAMMKPKLIQLAAETVGYGKFQKMMASPNRKVMHYWSASNALPVTPRAGYSAPVGPNLPAATDDVLSGGKVPPGASQGINRSTANVGGGQPYVAPTEYDPLVGAEVPTGPRQGVAPTQASAPSKHAPTMTPTSITPMETPRTAIDQLRSLTLDDWARIFEEAKRRRGQ